MGQNHERTSEEQVLDATGFSRVERRNNIWRSMQSIVTPSVFEQWQLQLPTAIGTGHSSPGAGFVDVPLAHLARPASPRLELRALMRTLGVTVAPVATRKRKTDSLPLAFQCSTSCVLLAMVHVSMEAIGLDLLLPLFEACDEPCLDEITSSLDAMDAGPTVEEECLEQKDAYNRVYNSDSVVAQQSLVDSAVQEELSFMRRLQVYHEVPESYMGQHGLRPWARNGSARIRATHHTQLFMRDWCHRNQTGELFDI